MKSIAAAVAESISQNTAKIILSKPRNQDIPHLKITLEKKKTGYVAEKRTPTQAFHETIAPEDVPARVCDWLETAYLQMNAWEGAAESMVLISKKGKVSSKKTKASASPVSEEEAEHDRKKRYLLKEGIPVPALQDMGIYTAQGQVVASMYDKFRQINRFVEMIDDALKDAPPKALNIVDFGCGKSYLTFILYHYLTQIRKIKATITGLDLKQDVIARCNQAAQKYGYDGLAFVCGNIESYQGQAPVDMVITLHACDTATDYALYNAVKWGAEYIFSVPCCQHELNRQISGDAFPILTRYGLLKDRFSAIATDAIRSNLLVSCGYDAQILEFIDFAHTPKNLLIRAKKREISRAKREEALNEVRALMAAFHLSPTLHTLLHPEAHR